MTSPPITYSFFEKTALELAPALLGTVLVHESPEGVTAGRIVETEAYMGPDDKAAHSYGGRPTERTRVMYGPAGYAYVYLIYGMHWCLNAVASEIGTPQAVLIRALEPIDGIPLMIERRGLSSLTSVQQNEDGTWPTTKIKSLTNGPGKLAKAMSIDKRQYGWSLVDSPLRILQDSSDGIPLEITTGPRIGIDYAEEAKEYPWRFWIKGNPFVSKG